MQDTPVVRARGGLFAAGAVALIARVLQVVAGAAVGLLVPLALVPSDVGLFFLALALVGVGALIAQLGLHLSTPALLAPLIAHGDRAAARVTAERIIVATLASGVVIAGLVWLGLLLAETLSAAALAAHLAALAPILGGLVVVSALSAVLAELYRANFAIAAASLLPLAQALMLTLLLAVALMTGWRPTVTTLLVGSLAAASAGIVGAFTYIMRSVREWPRSSARAVRSKEILVFTWPNLVTSASFFLASQFDIWIVGAFGGATDAAVYGLALRIAGIFGLPLTLAAMVLMPHIGTLRAHQRRRRLGAMLTLSATAATLVALVGLLGFALVGQPLIALVWGGAYDRVYPVALILGTGQLVQTGGGMAGYLLLLLGRQRTVMVTTLALSAVTITAAIAVMRATGIEGMAVVYALSTVAQSVCNAVLARRAYALRFTAGFVNPLRLRRLQRRGG
jgi:O-antigen/teichoic acid export membrane protein